ncbi:MAG TPA: hypothetical protein VIQ02_16155 [Jiangellaceae bacterium]
MSKPAGHACQVRRLSVLLLGATLTVTACSDDDLTQPSSSNSAPPNESVYAVLTDDAWTLQEAVDPPTDAPTASIERPPLEWYAEYVQSSASESAMVRLSGHQATFDDTRAALEDVGFTLDDLSLQHWQGAGGSAPADPASPTIIVLANGETTLMVLSYEEDLDQLTAIADRVEGVDQSTWVAAGGVIQ